MVNWSKTIVVNPASPSVEAAILGMVESAYYFETVDFIGFRRYLHAVAASNTIKIVSERLLEKVYLVMLRKKIVFKTILSGSVTEADIKKILKNIETRFGLSHAMIRQLWETKIPEKFMD